MTSQTLELSNCILEITPVDEDCPDGVWFVRFTSKDLLVANQVVLNEKEMKKIEKVFEKCHFEPDEIR